MLIEMLSDDYEDSKMNLDDLLHNMAIDPELKSIIYECLHAKDKVEQKEQETYEEEINQFIMKDSIKKKRQ